MIGSLSMSVVLSSVSTSGSFGEVVRMSSVVSVSGMLAALTAGGIRVVSMVVTFCVGTSSVATASLSTALASAPGVGVADVSSIVALLSLVSSRSGVGSVSRALSVLTVRVVVTWTSV